MRRKREVVQGGGRRRTGRCLRDAERAVGGKSPLLHPASAWRVYQSGKKGRSAGHPFRCDPPPELTRTSAAGSYFVLHRATGSSFPLVHFSPSVSGRNIRSECPELHHFSAIYRDRSFTGIWKDEIGRLASGTDEFVREMIQSGMCCAGCRWICVKNHTKRFVLRLASMDLCEKSHKMTGLRPGIDGFV